MSSQNGVDPDQGSVPEGHLRPEQIIPHRKPFLFVDEILELTPGRARTRLKIAPEASFLAGHYPGNPIMPGVLLCESVFQTAALCLLQGSASNDSSHRVPVLSKIEQARFRQMVRPGDELEVLATLQEALGQFFRMEGKVSCQGRLVLSLQCTLALTERP